MKNYYKILQVDNSASDEIIKTAYKTLVKKYHPDLRTGQEKKYAENKIKEINEAYDILSNNFKRNEYDNLFNKNYIPAEKYNLIIEENIKLKNELNLLKNNLNTNNNNTTTNTYYNTKQQSNNFNNNSYTESPKSSQNTNPLNNIFPHINKELLIKILSIFLTLIITFLLLQLPFIKNLFANFFENNLILIIIILLFIYLYFSNKN